jgi:hypothetical protein
MASTDWEDVRKYVEPVVSEINQPQAELVRIEVVLRGDGQESVRAKFSYENPTAEQKAALARHAADLVRGIADSIERPGNA